MKRKLWYGVIGVVLASALVALSIARVTHPAPETVFWDAISNNLSTSGVTRTITAGTSAQKITQITQLQLGQTPLSHSLTVVKGASGTVEAEEISDRKTDMVRYRTISTTQKTIDGKPLDFSAVTGKWARLAGGDSASGFTSGLFDATLLGIMPFGNLSDDARTDLVAYARDQSVFSFDAAQAKRQTDNGKTVYAYDVTVQPAAYVAFMQRYGKLVGASEFAGQSANDYRTAAVIPLTVRIDPVSRQLVSITQKNTGQTESYSAFGAQTATVIPLQQISLGELQDRLAAVRR